MSSASPRHAARNTHLIRAAQSAGEVFAYASVDPENPQRGSAMLVLWIAAGVLAAFAILLSI